MVVITASSQARSDSPASQQSQLDERDSGKDDEQDHRQGARVAELAFCETLFGRCGTASRGWRCPARPAVVTATVSKTWNEPVTVITKHQRQDRPAAAT